LLTAYEITSDEALSGITALAVLAPYYFGLYLMREKLKSGFQFEVHKQTI